MNSDAHPVAELPHPIYSIGFATGLALLFVLLWSGNLTAQDNAPAGASGGVTVDQIRIGIDGTYKVAEWTAARVRVQASSPQSVSLVVEAPDSDGNPASVAGAAKNISGSEAVTVEACFQTGRLFGELVLRLVDEQGHSLWQHRMRASSADDAELRPGLRHDVPLVVTFAALPETKSEMGTEKSPSSPLSSPPGTTTVEPRLIRVNEFDDLPEIARGLESIAAIVLPTARRTGGASPLETMNEARNSLLREWVQRGGHLLISVASEATTYGASPLAEWVPVKVEGTTTLRQFLDLERFSDLNSPVRATGVVRAAKLATLPSRNMLVKEGNIPLIASVPYGFGRVTVIALDVESSPLSSWSAFPAVLRKLVAGTTVSTRKTAAQPSNRQLSQTGITDLATQLQMSQEEFSEIPRPSHWWVMGLMIGYLLVIGPLDYLIVHRLFKRPELTWFTFGLLVCLGAGAAVWGANRINGTNLLFNQLDLVDVDATTKSVRGRTWVSFYSPENRRHAIAIAPDLKSIEPQSTVATQPALSWSGVPENSVNGVYRSGGAGFGGQRYEFASGSESVVNVPILQWSTKSFSATWDAESAGDLVEADLDSAGAGMLTGTITHRLPEPLEDCLLVVAGWGYFPSGDKPRVAPNVPWQPGGSQSRARDLKAFLTGEQRKKVENKEKFRSDIQTTTVPYDPLNSDRLDLVQMVSFHQVVGGAEYTGMRNAALRRLELTNLMGLGRGVLFGRIKSRVARTTVDGEAPAPADAQTFVRFIIPVRFSENAPAMRMPKPGEQLSDSPTP